MRINKIKDSFWPSYVDVMTNLFAIALVLFVVSFFWYKSNSRELLEYANQLEDKGREYDRIQEMNKAIQSLDSNKYFMYSRKYQKHILSKDSVKVEFLSGKYLIPEHLTPSSKQDLPKIKDVGVSIIKTINDLRAKYIIDNNNSFRIKFLIVIEGQASRSGEEYQNYILSYQRALSLKQFWDGIVYEGKKVSWEELNCELIVSGSGWYGSPREPDFLDKDSTIVNKANQRFLVHVVPVIDWKDKADAE